MSYIKGQRVRHPTQPNWGIGEVLEDSTGDVVRVFFVGAGEKSISGKYASLIPLDPSEAAHPVLDNLQLVQTPGLKYRSIAESIQFFLESYPEGFHGERYLKEERAYKLSACALARDLLGTHVADDLRESAACDDVCARALRVINATNLVFPNEKMALRDGLKPDAARKAFADGLLELLHGAGPLGPRFEAFADVLRRIGADKWTIATYFPFLVFPDRFVFVKPTVTQNAAAVCAFDISYSSRINYATYERIQQFAEYLRGELASLKPRDMIDVQSFMWCIAPRP